MSLSRKKLNPLSEEVLKGKFGYGSKITLKVEKGKITFAGTKGSRPLKAKTPVKKNEPVVPKD